MAARRPLAPAVTRGVAERHALRLQAIPVSHRRRWVSGLRLAAERVGRGREEDDEEQCSSEEEGDGRNVATGTRRRSGESSRACEK